jgi:hypothetical protein
MSMIEAPIIEPTESTVEITTPAPKDYRDNSGNDLSHLD